MDNVDFFLCALESEIEDGEKKSRFICRNFETEQNRHYKMILIGLLVKEKGKRILTQSEFLDIRLQCLFFLNIYLFG